MVKKGRFSVELVSADTRIAFMEHTKDDKTYAEVEPDVEYFVRLGVEPGPIHVLVLEYTSMASIWDTISM
jgi:hypothetical protein